MGLLAGPPAGTAHARAAAGDDGASRDTSHELLAVRRLRHLSRAEPSLLEGIEPVGVRPLARLSLKNVVTRHWPRRG